MKAFEITEQKGFMSALLVLELFDRFAVSKVQILAACHVELDGQRNALYYTDEEKKTLSEPEYMLWAEVKPLVYQMIKGNKLPSSIRLVFRLTSQNTENVLNSIKDGTTLSEVGGLFFNVQYEHERLLVTSGTMMKTFSLSKSIEQAWDGYVERFLRKNGIAYREV